MKNYLVLLIAFTSMALATYSPYGRRNRVTDSSYSNCKNARTHVYCYHYGRYRRSGYRSLSGICNNLHRKIQGASNTILRRYIPASYIKNTHGVPRGYPNTLPKVPHANDICSKLFKVTSKNSQHTKKGISVIFMTFGQFLDHDMSLTPHATCSVKSCGNLNIAYKYPCFPIKFSKTSHACTAMGRSVPACQSRYSPKREFINIISSYIDASNVYHNDFKIHTTLRKNDGSGQMKLLKNGLLPLTKTNCKLTSGCSLVGEARGDENIALNAMHTLWVREHNRIAKKLKQINPHWRGYRLFQAARKIVGATLQHITYNEFLPLLVNLDQYKGYNRHVDPTISNGFSAAAFRFGHSLVPNGWALMNKNFDIYASDLPIRLTFNNITYIRKHGIESIIYGLLANQSQEVDTLFSVAVARRLFVPPNKNEHRDLTALNIQRGRDHGVPTYGHWRKVCGLKALKSFSDLHGIIRPTAISALRRLYKHPNDIDLYAAGISELPLSGRKLGETFHCIIKDQFERLRSGDYFFYQNRGIFTARQLKEIRKTTLSKVLCNNLNGVVSLQRDAFKAFNTGARRYECGSIPDIDLLHWKSRRRRRPYDETQSK